MPSGIVRERMQYDTEWIERLFDESELYLTREELQDWEAKHHQCINWETWDRISQLTKQQLAEYDYSPKKTHKRGRKASNVYIYDTNTRELLRAFPSALEASEWANTSVKSILHHCKTKTPYNGFAYSFTKLEKEEVPQEDWVYAYKLDTKELLGRYKTAVDAARAFNLPISKVGYLMLVQAGRYPSQNLYFSKLKLWQEPKNQYGQETLKEK